MITRPEMKPAPAASHVNGSQRGSAIVVFAGCVLLIAYFCALIIDLGRAEYSAHTIQRAADAASLAGASELVFGAADNNERWKNSRKAAIDAVRKNLIYAEDAQFPEPQASTTNRSGIDDNCETDNHYASETLDNTKMGITIERGLYTDGAASPFVSLESSSVCNSGNNPLPNAVRVTVTVHNYNNVFAGIPPFNRAKFDHITRIGIAANIE